MVRKVAFIGFGEAAQAFVGVSASLTGYDRKTRDPSLRAAKLAEFAALGVDAAEDPAAALGGTKIAFSLVTADQAVPAARAADGLQPNSLWLDCNSVAPETKRIAAEAIEARGGRYVDVAVMSPVLPAKLGTPLLLSGPHISDAAALLRGLGFARVDTIDGPVGMASSVKMIRSVMIKGIEALSAECAVAAEAAGVRDAVIASLDASWPGANWARRIDYNLDRMLVHGTRRAAEMEEVVKTLDAMDVGSVMSRGTIEMQRALGGLGGGSPESLDAKLAVVGRPRRKEVA